MIRIRFHGRGGHGVKTASRIVGTAAFLAGHHCQDSPVYGAERRGAAVVAFTRISDDPILERGVIDHPDLIVVADETLLDDPAAGVLAGQESASALFLNTTAAEPLVEKIRHHPRSDCIRRDRQDDRSSRRCLCAECRVGSGRRPDFRCDLREPFA